MLVYNVRKRHRSHIMSDAFLAGSVDVDTPIASTYSCTTAAVTSE